MIGISAQSSKVVLRPNLNLKAQRATFTGGGGRVGWGPADVGRIGKKMQHAFIVLLLVICWKRVFRLR